MNDDKLICPYCKKEQYNHTYDEIISAYMCFTECEHCNKEFWYGVKVIREYYSYGDDENDD